MNEAHDHVNPAPTSEVLPPSGWPAPTPPAPLVVPPVSARPAGWVLGLVGGIVLAVGAVLPWYVVTGPLVAVGISGVHADGAITLAFGVAAALLAGRRASWGRLPLVGVLTALVGYDLVAALNSTPPDGLTLTVGVGLWATVVACVCLIVWAATSYRAARRTGRPVAF